MAHMKHEQAGGKGKKQQRKISKHNRERRRKRGMRTKHAKTDEEHSMEKKHYSRERKAPKSALSRRKI